ncbi:uncharacterized protein PFL1_01456 [Pseudozyma flocculosa PF-1]|uniref:Related to DnaJ protein n=1 Tax=Pseudozyma flocculosa TaxID=84751 RepID=A0A5C3EWJ4_9BASI|nr:uncharacterized protein PFL1_01456 [Pseudozyma flocculosa PF-1]EPQ31271.1 hypothetical protein PFL1_01456 [Pseudozyma flocculosa PF-1]SPO36230.1 related to DnaJ protein [Pseudozyma flocculosa]
MDEEDPALQFFPDGNVDLYATLGVEKSATGDEIKKAYKKLALKFHPDKVLSSATPAAANGSSSSSSANAAPSAEETILKFQRIGFAYAVLSDDVRRKKYDNTGSTRELGIGEGVDDFDWNDYFKTLWTGEVSKQTLEDFKQKYQNSDEERDDIAAAYDDSDGSLEAIFAAVPCSEFLVDEQRIIDIIERLIDEGQLERKPAWTKTSKDKAGRARLRKKAQGEAKEAEKLARELGVWDDLFGDGANKAKAAAAAAKKRAAKGGDDDKQKDQEEDEDESDEGPRKRSSRTKADAKGKAANGTKAKAGSKRGGGGGGADDDSDLAGLQALMRRKAQNRASAFDDMIAKLEAKSGGKESRPSDEEFERIQKEMMERRNSGGGGGGAAEPKKKRSAAGSSSSSSKAKKTRR